MLHHLILIRESSAPMFSGCCAMVPASMAEASGRISCALREEWSAMHQELRAEFGQKLEITPVDPRNGLAVAILILRDALRFRPPLREVLRSLASPTLATGILDGRVLFRGTLPAPEEIRRLIHARMAGADRSPAFQEIAE